MEKDDEVYGSTGNSYDFGARMYDSRVGHFLGMDAFAAKFPSRSPFSFAGNNPVNAVDINGDSIIFVGELNKKFKSGLGVLLTTPTGREIIQKYYHSQTVDVYITMSSIDIPGALANTYPTDATKSIITNQGIVDSKKLGALLSAGDEYAFDGVDVGGSIKAGRKVALVTIDGVDYGDGGKRSKFDMARTLFHELKAHIEDAEYDMPLGNERWNMEHIIYGDNGLDSKTGERIYGIGDSPARVIGSEIEDYKSWENGGGASQGHPPDFKEVQSVKVTRDQKK